MLFKREIEALWGGGFKSVELDPLTIWNIFYYFFGNFLHGEKVDLGNKERPSVQCLNALLLPPKSDCVEINQREKRVKKLKKNSGNGLAKGFLSNKYSPPKKNLIWLKFRKYIPMYSTCEMNFVRRILRKRC